MCCIQKQEKDNNFPVLNRMRKIVNLKAVNVLEYKESAI